MFSSQFLSRTNCSLFLAVPTVRRAMRHSLLLRRPPTLPSSSSSSAPPSTAAVFSHDFSVKEEQQQQKQQQQQQQPNANQQTDGRGLVELTLRLQDQLAKIGERVAHANNVIQQQATAFSHLQRQQAVLERRVVTLEEEDARMQQRITETTRLASDLVLQHRNVEMLVGQMEKLVLKHTTTYSVKGGKPLSAANTFPPSAGSHGEKQTLQHATNTGSSASGVQTNSKPMMAVAPPSHSAPLSSSSSVAVSPDLLKIETQVSTLSVRLEALQARIDQLTLEKLVLDKVELHAQTLQKKTQEQQETVVEQAVSRVATAAMTKDERGGAVGSAAHSKKNLAALLKNAGAFPFRDNTGATRISSQKVLVRGLPVMFGASEVRDLFSRAGTVVSCVVRRMSTVRTAAKTTTAPPAAASRYRSQQNQEEEKGNEEKKVGEKESSDQITNGSSGAATVTSTAAEKQERAFEVTYQTVEQAVRAVLQLEGYQLHGKYTLSVEPVVSADIIAAMQQLEEESKKE